MQIHDVSKQVGLTKRAIKWYEEKGLLQVQKDNNGYRNYSKANIKTLQTIAACRRCGMRIDAIGHYLQTGEHQILNDAYKEKQRLLHQIQAEMEALQMLMDPSGIERSIDARTIAAKLQDAIPGFYGYFFFHHFMPYLQENIHTLQQQEAYDKIIDFWDNTTIQIPLYMRITGWLTWKFKGKETVHTSQPALKLDENQYQILKRQVQKGYRIKRVLKYHPAFIAQRKFMRELRDKGYNDVFIPNLCRLSPAYKTYHEALLRTNERICKELGLAYDSDFHLIKK